MSHNCKSVLIQNCLHLIWNVKKVLEVCELGVSGSKSVGKPGEPIKMKEDKELKPASMRVREAAENLLTNILEQVAYFPNQCGPESTSSLLNEVLLLRLNQNNYSINGWYY